MELAAVVPLEADELIATAVRLAGASDFGDDYWREPFKVLVQSLNEEAALSLFGRLATRDNLLASLRTRLQIEATYARYPQIDDEAIDSPLMVTGLPRSGTSILFEILSQDSNLGALLSWEVEFPCPPPEASTYSSDPRIELAEKRVTRRNRMAPKMKAIHELGARIPTECGNAFMHCSFTSEHLAARYCVPAYADYLSRRADWLATYRYHRRLLKLLQWKNPRRHWLLKSPPHIWHLEPLFEVFPDAKVIFSHRDPLRAKASGVSLVATLRGMWSDQPFDAESFAQISRAQVTAAGLEGVIAQIETGKIPRQQMFNSHYAQLMTDPLAAIEELYGQMGWLLEDQTRQRMRDYLDHKPKGKYGVHYYDIEDDPEERACFQRYQQYYGVVNEY